MTDSSRPDYALAIKSTLDALDEASLEKLWKETDRLNQARREEADVQARDAAIRLLDDWRTQVNARADREPSETDLAAVTSRVLWLLARVEKLGNWQTRPWDAYTEDGTERIRVEPELVTAVSAALRDAFERGRDGAAMLRGVLRALGADADTLLDYRRARHRK